MCYALIKEQEWQREAETYVWAAIHARLSPSRLIDSLERNEIEWNGARGTFADVETKEPRQTPARRAVEWQMKWETGSAKVN